MSYRTLSFLLPTLDMHCTDTHLADGLELLVLIIIARQQEASIGARPLAFPQVGADHTQVHCVTHPV